MGILYIFVVNCPKSGSTNVECIKNCGGSALRASVDVETKTVVRTYRCLDCGATFSKLEIGSIIGGCYITTATFTALGICNDNCDELQKFRWYRDNILIKEPDGKELIEEYYKTAPLIVRKIEEMPNKEEIYKQIWDRYLSKCLEFLNKKQFAKVKKTYIEMVRTLQKKFLKGE